MNNFLIIVSICFGTFVVNAQPFQMAGPFANRFGVTTTTGANNVRAIGIGAFTSTNRPLAAFHANANLLPGSTDFGIGEIFRTTSNATGTNLNAWRFWTGSGIGAEKGRIFNIGTGLAFNLQSSAGDMIFRTGGGNTNIGRPSMQIYNSNGFIGMGNTDSFTAQSLLHLHNNTTPSTVTEQSTYEQFTVDGTNGTDNGSDDGFKIGVRSFWNGTAFQSNAELRQQEDAPLDIFTTNLKRAFFSTANFFTNNNTTATGYGLRVLDPVTSSIGHLDMWTGQSSTTHMYPSI